MLKKIFKSPKSEFVVVGILLLIGIAIRAYHFGSVPTGIHQDEAMAAVDAKALADYGTDRFGMRYPVHFTAWSSSQMSVLLSYCMIPFIKLFGFSVLSIRLPMLLTSCIGLGVLYLFARRVGGIRLGMAAFILGILCPWHYMQSRWSLDCNMFPHVFLIGVVLLGAGIKKHWLLYLSMVFFGLCSYCYGIADYSVPLFLLMAAIYLLRGRMVRLRDILMCAALYFLVALPEFLTMFVNALGAETIETPFFTIPYFPESGRAKNILFLNFSWAQLWENIRYTVQSIFGVGDYALSNNIPLFGPLYYITPPFFLLGLVQLPKDIKKSSSREESFPAVLLLLWFCMGLWIGLVTEEVSVHRINVIYYAMVVIAGRGILWCIHKCKYLVIPIGAAYMVLAMMFAHTYFGYWAKQSRTFYYYDVYVNALTYAKTLPCDYYYIYPDPQGEGIREVGEIITLFCHDIDAHYYQGISTLQGGQEVLPYKERYHFETVTEETIKENEGKSVVYLVHHEQAPLFDGEDYDICSFYDAYYVISPKK